MFEPDEDHLAPTALPSVLAEGARALVQVLVMAAAISYTSSMALMALFMGVAWTPLALRDLMRERRRQRPFEWVLSAVGLGKSVTLGVMGLQYEDLHNPLCLLLLVLVALFWVLHLVAGQGKASRMILSFRDDMQYRVIHQLDPGMSLQQRQRWGTFLSGSLALVGVVLVCVMVF